MSKTSYKNHPTQQPVKALEGEEEIRAFCQQVRSRALMPDRWGPIVEVIRWAQKACLNHGVPFSDVLARARFLWEVERATGKTSRRDSLDGPYDLVDLAVPILLEAKAYCQRFEPDLPFELILTFAMRSLLKALD